MFTLLQLASTAFNGGEAEQFLAEVAVTLSQKQMDYGSVIKLAESKTSLNSVSYVRGQYTYDQKRVIQIANVIGKLYSKTITILENVLVWIY